MEITEVRIKLMGEQERLLGFSSIIFDGCFVVRDLKIIRGTRGVFVAMPSRKLTDKCHHCGGKNDLRASYCGDCGKRLLENRATKGAGGRAKLFADIAHPINGECRDRIQKIVISTFESELILARQPGYVCRYDDLGEFSGDEDLSHCEDPADFTRRDSQRRIDPAANHPAPGPHEVASDSFPRPTQIPGQTAPEFGDGIL